MTVLPATLWKRRLILWLAIGLGLLIVAGANAHLVFVAVTSQPDCVAHVRPGEGAHAGQYGAAESSCQPE